MTSGRKLRTLALSLLIAAVLSACAGGIVTQPGVRAHVVAKTGQEVILYAGDAKDSAKMFCPGDELAAYHGSDKTPAGGRVRIIAYSGEHHLRGVVIEGSVVKGDLVKKGGVACTVQSAPAPAVDQEGIETPKPK